MTSYLSKSMKSPLLANVDPLQAFFCSPPLILLKATLIREIEFPHAEGLGDVVVRAHLQTEDTIHLIAFRA